MTARELIEMLKPFGDTPIAFAHCPHFALDITSVSADAQRDYVMLNSAGWTNDCKCPDEPAADPEPGQPGWSDSDHVEDCPALGGLDCSCDAKNYYGPRLP